LFSNPEVVALIKEHCVPLAMDETLYREVKDRDAVWPAGDSSVNGTWSYILTASGKPAARMVREDAVAVLKRGLEAFAKLPEEERKPSATVLDDLEKRSRVGRRPVPPPPPANGLILKVIGSHLERHPKEEIVRAAAPYHGDVMRDSLWLTEAEWKSLVPADPRKGDQHAAPQAIRDRIFRFYLNNRFQGGPGDSLPWRREEIRAGQLDLTVEAVSADVLHLALRGSALIASDAVVAKSQCGCDAALFGYLDYDRRQQRFTRFDVAALADCWWFKHPGWTGQFAHLNDRVGRIVIGVAFELAPPDTAFYSVPPRYIGNDYFGKVP